MTFKERAQALVERMNAPLSKIMSDANILPEALKLIYDLAEERPTMEVPDRFTTKKLSDNCVGVEIDSFNEMGEEQKKVIVTIFGGTMGCGQESADELAKRLNQAWDDFYRD